MSLVTCQVYVPVLADSTKLPHPADVIDAWEADLVATFGGFTRVGNVHGFWRDGAGIIVPDESRAYLIGVEPARLDDLRAFVRAACVTFDQRCIFFQIVGTAEFLEP